MEELFNNIIENTPQAHFWIIFSSGYIWCIAICIISNIDRFVTMRMWKMIDYERIINEHLDTYNVDNNEDKMLIARAKRNAEIRYQNKQKKNKILNKIFKKRVKK